MGLLSLFAAAASATGTLGLANTPEGQELLNGDLARQLKEQGIDIQELFDAIKDIQENKIPAVDTKTTDLAWDIATLNTTLTEHKTKLADLETRMVAQETASTEIGGRTNALETLTEGFKTTFADIQETMGGLGTKITELTGNFQTFITETLPQQFETWRQDIATAWGNGISNLRTELKPLIDSVTTQFNTLIQVFATPVKSGVDWVKDRIEDIRDFVKKHLPFDSILNWQLPQGTIQIPSLLPTPSGK